MQEHHFNVFGRIILVRREGTLWQTYLANTDGKKTPANFVIPDFIGVDELEQHLFDLFHESATPTNGEVRRIT
jgi:hypothetical protein